MSSREQSAKSWRVLLGNLASLIHLVPGSRLCLRSLQLALRSGWDFVDESVLVAWDDSCQTDLLWWYDEDRLTDGVSLESHLPELMFWSDASDQGWGATMSEHCRSGLWSEEEARLSINVRELLTVEKGLRAFLPSPGAFRSGVLRQHHSDQLSASPRRNFVSNPQHCSSAAPSLGGGSR